jgi:hypothetical protein
MQAEVEPAAVNLPAGFLSFRHAERPTPLAAVYFL